MLTLKQLDELRKAHRLDTAPRRGYLTSMEELLDGYETLLAVRWAQDEIVCEDCPFQRRCTDAGFYAMCGLGGIWLPKTTEEWKKAYREKEVQR